MSVELWAINSKINRRYKLMTLPPLDCRKTPLGKKLCRTHGLFWPKLFFLLNIFQTSSTLMKLFSYYIRWWISWDFWIRDLITLVSYIDLIFKVLVFRRDIESVFCKTAKVSSIQDTSVIKMKFMIDLLTVIMVIWFISALLKYLHWKNTSPNSFCL